MSLLYYLALAALITLTICLVFMGDGDTFFIFTGTTIFIGFFMAIFPLYFGRKVEELTSLEEPESHRSRRDEIVYSLVAVESNRRSDVEREHPAPQGWSFYWTYPGDEIR